MVPELRRGSVWEGTPVSLWGAGINVLYLDLGGGLHRPRHVQTIQQDT